MHNAVAACQQHSGHPSSCGSSVSSLHSCRCWHPLYILLAYIPWQCNVAMLAGWLACATCALQGVCQSGLGLLLAACASASARSLSRGSRRFMPWRQTMHFRKSRCSASSSGVSFMRDSHSRKFAMLHGPCSLPCSQHSFLDLTSQSLLLHCYLQRNIYSPKVPAQYSSTANLLAGHPCWSPSPSHSRPHNVGLQSASESPRHANS